MLALFFEFYGAVCFFSLAAFLIWAAVAKLRPDLDEDLVEFEKLKRLISSEQASDAFPVYAPITEDDAPKSAPARPVKPSKRLVQRAPRLLHARKPRMT
jgi:hypothetical protein